MNHAPTHFLLFEQGLAQPGWWIATQDLLQLFDGVTDRGFGFTFDRMNLFGNQACRCRTTDLGDINKGTVGQAGTARLDAVGFVNAGRADLDNAVEACRFGSNLPDNEFFRPSEMFINVYLVGAGKCHVHMPSSLSCAVDDVETSDSGHK